MQIMYVMYNNLEELKQGNGFLKGGVGDHWKAGWWAI